MSMLSNANANGEKYHNGLKGAIGLNDGRRRRRRRKIPVPRDAVGFARLLKMCYVKYDCSIWPSVQYVALASNFRGTNSCNLIHFSTFFYRIMTNWRQTTLPRFFHQHQTLEQTSSVGTIGNVPSHNGYFLIKYGNQNTSPISIPDLSTFILWFLIFWLIKARNTLETWGTQSYSRGTLKLFPSYFLQSRTKSID